MKKLVKFLLSAFVDQPQKIKIKENVGEENLLTLTVKVSPEDIGKVIGKNGKMVKTLTCLARIRALKMGKRIALEIKD